MHVFISCGELSAERHARDVADALKAEHGRAGTGSLLRLNALGSDLLREGGVELWADYREVNVMGVLEVIGRLGAILALQRELVRRLVTEGVDVVLLVDYSGFNLRLARRLRHQGYQGRILYYIPPKAWAWGGGRVASLRRDVDKCLTILPFEESFFKRHGVPCVYVGNPSFWRIRMESATDDAIGRPLVAYIALLPGSRPQELARMVPLLAEVARRMHRSKFKVAALSKQGKLAYQTLAALSNVEVVYDRYEEVIRRASVAAVTSGTATLETALLGVPQVVVYQTSALTAFMARLVLSIRYVSLVNLILDEALVTELLQKDCTPNRIEAEIKKLMNGETGRDRQLAGYERLMDMLGTHETPTLVAREVLAPKG